MNQISFAAFSDFNSTIPWGLWVSIYIWLVGISAGSFLLVAWGNIKENQHLKSITHLGISLSLAAFSVGLLSILIDLGHIERFYKLFISPSPISVMAWMVWLYSAYALLLFVSILLLKKNRLTGTFLSFALLCSLAVILIESLLFAIPPGRHWHSPIFVIHFITSSLVSAVTALICASFVFAGKEKKVGLLEGLRKIAVPIVALNLCVEIIDIISLGKSDHVTNWILPIASIIVMSLFLVRNSISMTFFAGLTGLISTLASKYTTLVSAQAIEPFKGFASAYIEERLKVAYTPTLFEIVTSAVLICSGLCIFYILHKILPLTREE